MFVHLVRPVVHIIRESGTIEFCLVFSISFFCRSFSFETRLILFGFLYIVSSLTMIKPMAALKEKYNNSLVSKLGEACTHIRPTPD